MSVAAHDGVRSAERERHQRLVIAAAVVATLAVIAGPMLAGALGLHGRPAPFDALTPDARRVLKELPGAFETAGLVVVPAATDPNLLWTGPISPDQVDDPVVSLGVDGLAEHGDMHLQETAPAWLRQVGAEDLVFEDVGNLSFACTRWPGAQTCSGTLLMEHLGERYILRSGLGLPRSPGEVSSFQVLDDGLPSELVLGGAPPEVRSVEVTMVGGGRVLAARTTAPGAVGGTTLWWASVPAPVAVVTFLDARGQVLARSPVTQ